jgi:hypothetical protein
MTADLFSETIAPLIAAVSGLSGVLIGGLIASHHQRQERRQRFSRDQLTEFYAPLLGMRERLRARGEIRLKVNNAADAAWRSRMEEAGEGGIENLSKTEETLWPRYQRIIDDHNEQLKNDLMPLYRQMADVFTAKMQFAEPSTRQHFRALIEFVELWERYVRDALPGAVADRVVPSEERLSDFYADLQTNFERLQVALKA